MNEIEIMKELHHKNIMKLEEIHESNNSIYLVMELLKGGELFEQISKKKRIEVEDVRHIMGNLLDALLYLQKKRIMHRDLKPENMILADKGDLRKTQLKLVDFGLSSFCEENPYLFSRCGTPGFVAPEIINSSSSKHVPFQPKVDVFSAGIIFYIMLVGKSPFKANSF